MDITLYFTPQTRAVRPRWLLEELGLPYQLQHIDLFAGEGESEEYKQIHPLGAVPAMKVDGEVMLESAAICHWLTDYHSDAGLAPAINDSQRMKYEQWMFFSQATLEVQPWLVIMHSKILDEKHRVAEIIPWALDRHKTILKMMNDELDHQNYLLGNSFSTADIMLGSVLMMLPDTLAKYPDLMVYVQRLKERPAFQKAIS